MHLRCIVKTPTGAVPGRLDMTEWHSGACQNESSTIQTAKAPLARPLTLSVSELHRFMLGRNLPSSLADCTAGRESHPAPKTSIFRSVNVICCGGQNVKLNFKIHSWHEASPAAASKPRAPNATARLRRCAPMQSAGRAGICRRDRPKTARGGREARALNARLHTTGAAYCMTAAKPARQTCATLFTRRMRGRTASGCPAR